MPANFGWKVTGSKLGSRKELSLKHLLKSTLPIVIYMHSINSFVRCIGRLYICFTRGRWNMSPINKRCTRVVATFKKVKQGQL